MSTVVPAKGPGILSKMLGILRFSRGLHIGLDPDVLRTLPILYSMHCT